MKTPTTAAGWVHALVVTLGYLAAFLAQIQEMPGVPSKFHQGVAIALFLVSAGIHAAGKTGPTSGSGEGN